MLLLLPVVIELLTNALLAALPAYLEGLPLPLVLGVDGVRDGNAIPTFVDIKVKYVVGECLLRLYSNSSSSSVVPSFVLCLLLVGDDVTLASTANNSDPVGAPLLLLLLLVVDGLLERLQYGLVKISEELSSPPVLSSPLVMLATTGGGGGGCLVRLVCLCLCLLYKSC